MPLTFTERAGGSHPLGVRELKQLIYNTLRNLSRSHPLGVRELKPSLAITASISGFGRTL